MSMAANGSYFQFWIELEFMEFSLQLDDFIRVHISFFLTQTLSISVEI